MFLLGQYRFSKNKHEGELTWANAGVKLGENFNFFSKGTTSELCG
jgi:hypothetical protein